MSKEIEKLKATLSDRAMWFIRARQGDYGFCKSIPVDQIIDLHQHASDGLEIGGVFELRERALKKICGDGFDDLPPREMLALQAESTLLLILSEPIMEAAGYPKTKRKHQHIIEVLKGRREKFESLIKDFGELEFKHESAIREIIHIYHGVQRQVEINHFDVATRHVRRRFDKYIKHQKDQPNNFHYQHLRAMVILGELAVIRFILGDSSYAEKK